MTTRAEAPARPAARPPLKWAGGKRQLLPTFRPFYPQTFGTYFEPFLGSGAVFLDLHGRGDLRGRRAVLSDTNPDVIGCYRAIRDDVERVIEDLRTLAARHARDGERFFYEVRDKRFNPLREQAFRMPDPARGYTTELAAMLIYLNRTGFNGLFRLNSKGWFNVPIGRYVNPRICDRDNLRQVAAALGASGVRLECQPFDAVLKEVSAGDFCYFDPPYAPLSRTAYFTAYTARGFDAEDQHALRDVVVTLAERGCLVMVSNSSAPAVRRLYAVPAAERAGLRIHQLPARRAINARADRRGAVIESLITNLRPV
jgi:DNA adenine methylase